MNIMEIMIKFQKAERKQEMYDLALQIRKEYGLPIIRLSTKKKLENKSLKLIRNYLIFTIQEAWLKDSKRIPRENNNFIMELDL